MKKLFYKVSMVAVILTMCMAMTMVASAKDNTSKTAYQAELNTTYSAIFECYGEDEWGDVEYDYERWYKFTAPSNGWYEFEILNPYYSNEYEDYESSLTVYDSNGEMMGYGYPNEITGKCMLPLELKGGKTYYIKLENYADEEYTLKFIIRKHVHTYSEMDFQKSEIDDWGDGYVFYFGGYKDGFCDVCDYYYYRDIPAIKKMSLSSTVYTYNGKVHKPTVSITLENGKKLTSSNYSVSYSSGCKNVGTYKATVKGKNDYTGSQTLKFKINPKGTSIKSLTRAKKAFTVKWGKQSTQTTGYQIRYSKKSSMASAKTVTVKSTKTTSKKIKSLKAKTTYYVQVRTYKTVNNTKYYSAWSAKKSVKTK